MNLSSSSFGGALSLAATLLLGTTSGSQAAVQTFSFTVADTAAGLGAGPYGSVSVTEVGSSLDFAITLTPGYRFHAGNGNHNNFVFDLVGDPLVSITNITGGTHTFVRLGGPGAADLAAPPFGAGNGTTWDYGVDCSNCGAGFAGGDAGPLSFRVTPNSGSLSLASLAFQTFTVNSVSSNIYFASDLVRLVDNEGLTGNVGATISSAVPELSTWLMMLLGFAGVGFVAYRRQRIAAA